MPKVCTLYFGILYFGILYIGILYSILCTEYRISISAKKNLDPYRAASLVTSQTSVIFFLTSFLPIEAQGSLLTLACRSFSRPNIRSCYFSASTTCGVVYMCQRMLLLLLLLRVLWITKVIRSCGRMPDAVMGVCYCINLLKIFCLYTVIGPRKIPQTINQLFLASTSFSSLTTAGA